MSIVVQHRSLKKEILRALSRKNVEYFKALRNLCKHEELLIRVDLEECTLTQCIAECGSKEIMDVWVGENDQELLKRLGRVIK